MERPSWVNCVKAGCGRTLCTLHLAEGLYTAIGSLQELYERFLISNLTKQLQPHRRECTVKGPSSILTL